VLICAAIGNAYGGTPDQAVIETPPPPSPWEFRIEPYGWLTGTEGITGVKGLTTEINESFDEIFDHLNRAAALQMEARNGRWGILADGFYADLSSSGNPPGPLYKSVDADFKQFIGELAVSYRVYESPKGFVDIYSGFRYNHLSLDLSAKVNTAEAASRSMTASGRITAGLKTKADQIASARAAEFKAASVADRTVIEAEVRSAIAAEADGTFKRDLEKELIKLRRTIPNRLVRLDLEKTALAVEKQRIGLAKASGQLEIAKLRASVDSSLKNKVVDARTHVSDAKKKLSDSLGKQLRKQLPVSASADKDWVDPIIGVRAQWNIDDHFYLATKDDIGGFGVSSDLVWTLQATVGYRFNENVSAELGYRYLNTDYSDGGFTYDIAQSGLFTGLNITF
jgi:hypothetical protein